MGTLPPSELLKKWRLKTMTVEMAVGHILQHLVKIVTALSALNITLYNLRADVDSLIAHTGMSPDPKDAKKCPRKK